MKIIQGILVGALFSGLLSAICACYLALISNTTGELGLKTRDFWWLALIMGGLFGLIVGGFIGAIVYALNLNIIKGGLLGLLLTIIPACFLLLSGDKFDIDIRRFGVAFVVISTLAGIIVSLSRTGFRADQ